MIWIVFGCTFFVGLVAGVGIAALFVEGHVRSEIERAYSLGYNHGSRDAERLVPFPTHRAA